VKSVSHSSQNLSTGCISKAEQLFIMMSLEDLMAEMERGENLRATPKAAECTVSYYHDCLHDKYGPADGLFVVLFWYLEYPDERVRQNNQHVQRFHETKAVSSRGMGNGPSSLKFEVKPENIA
jgi:hypothetical protein